MTTRYISFAAVGAILLTLGPAALSASEAVSSLAAPAVYCYQVSAVNSVGEGPRSNEICVSVGNAARDFQKFVNDEQAAAYYAKWAHDNPGELSRWSAFRNAVLAGRSASVPVMGTKYGAGLVDGGVLRLDSP